MLRTCKATESSLAVFFLAGREQEKVAERTMSITLNVDPSGYLVVARAASTPLHGFLRRWSSM
ncbi:hypothetical protein [Mycobacterium uberis]|uniref:hypothetical protein n=1 Tax=Mycobacterium uberis TaxID=2162698 RepID=UPI0010584AC2|nr:hypothetical protein [Mycobacterium uberis]